MDFNIELSFQEIAEPNENSVSATACSEDSVPKPVAAYADYEKVSTSLLNCFYSRKLRIRRI